MEEMHLMKHHVLTLYTVLCVTGCYDFEALNADLDAPNLEARPSDRPPEPRDGESYWVWVGPQTEAPACPHNDAPAWEAFLNVTASPPCEGCTCSPAACQLPTRVTTYPGIRCGGEVTRNFDIGPGLDGACFTTGNPIPDADFASVLYAPPTPGPCTPSGTPRRPLVDATWVRGCHVTDENVITTDFKTCTPPNGLGRCTDPGKKLYTFPKKWNDYRECEPCACGEPSGGECEARVTLYKDRRCSTELDVSVIISTDGPLCSDVTSGPLASMKVELTFESFGTCTPLVSRVWGGAELGETITLCCDP
jgi:hypothetical protein